MRYRLLSTPLRAALTAALVTAAAGALAGQTGGPRTPWGDPDLQGTYTNTYENGTGSMMPAIYGNQYQIVQAPGYVAILYEMIHETRVIPLDPSTALGAGSSTSRGASRHRLSPKIQHDMGDPRGRWEGDTLVVETTNFKERSVYRNANPERLKLTERFMRIAPDKVRWSVTVDDQTTWTRPWTFALPLTADPNPLPLYECHEGNYGLRNILSAARAVEAGSR